MPPGACLLPIRSMAEFTDFLPLSVYLYLLIPPKALSRRSMPFAPPGGPSASPRLLSACNASRNAFILPPGFWVRYLLRVVFRSDILSPLVPFYQVPASATMKSTTIGGIFRRTFYFISSLCVLFLFAGCNVYMPHIRIIRVHRGCVTSELISLLLPGAIFHSKLHTCRIGRIEIA